jgi:hypothetical protein
VKRARRAQQSAGPDLEGKDGALTECDPNHSKRRAPATVETVVFPKQIRDRKEKAPTASSAFFLSRRWVLKSLLDSLVGALHPEIPRRDACVFAAVLEELSHKKGSR